MLHKVSRSGIVVTSMIFVAFGVSVALEISPETAQSNFEIPLTEQEWHGTDGLIPNAEPETLLRLWEISRAGVVADSHLGELRRAPTYGSDELAVMCAIALGNETIGDTETISQLLGLTEHKSETVVCAAIYSLGRQVEAGSTDGRIIPALVRLSLLTHPVNKAASQVLTRLSQSSDQLLVSTVIEELSEALLSHKWTSRFHSLWNDMGQPLADYLADVALSDAPDGQRDEACNIISEIYRLASFVEPQMLECLKDPVTQENAGDALRYTEIKDLEQLVGWLVDAMNAYAEQVSVIEGELWPHGVVDIPEAPARPKYYGDRGLLHAIGQVLKGRQKQLKGNKDLLKPLVRWAISPLGFNSQVQLPEELGGKLV